MWLPYKILIILIILQKTNSQKGCPPQDTILPCRCLIRGKEYQIWCSHSNLSSVLEGLKQIGSFITTPIDELILENNYLPSLPGRTFATLKILRLMLRHNSLERVTTDWLTGLETSLMELYIVEPKLATLPQTSLEQLKSLKAVTIRTKLLKRMPIFSGLPLLNYVQIESQSLIDIHPNVFKNNPSLEKLHVSSSHKLNRLEANVFDNLPNLDLINITNCGLNWVHPRAFSRLPNLKELSLTGNKITDPGMIGRASRELPNLEILRLDLNYIGTLEEATFVDISALKHIHLSYNVIGEIKKGSFHRLPALKTLDLSRNMLRRIQKQSFIQPVNLEEINLSHNDLTDVIQFRSILEDLPTLIYLDVSHNKIDAIPFGTLPQHSNLEHLNLGYNKLQYIDREAFILMPSLRELTLNNNTIMDNIRVPFWNLPELKGLDLSMNYIRRLEHNFLDNIKMLRRAYLSANHLSFIDPEAFLSTPLLEHINMSYNDLKLVHPATFRHLTQLYELDISDNHLKTLIPALPGNVEHLHLQRNEISKISADYLRLPSLRLLDLSENRIQSLEDGQMRSLGRLRKLFLRSNFLRFLSEKSLDGLLQLEVLDLSDNRISEINPQCIKSITELKILNLAQNQLNLIGPSLLVNAKHLKKFNASYNQLGEILANTFEGNFDIEEIDLSSNLLVHFPDSIYGLKKLKSLNLSRNRLKNLNSTIISSLTNLREIKLSKNFIQILESNTFNHLKHIKTLFIDDNDIAIIESNFIKMLPLLKHLKLDKNKIEQLPELAFNTLISLQEVELQDNQIKYINAQAFYIVPQLLTLNLSRNDIRNLADIGLDSLRSLELLDVSYNKIQRLDLNLDDLEWLVELRLGDNLICDVNEGVFKNMPRLKVLDLKNNKLVYVPEVAVERLRENTAELNVVGNPLECSCDMLWLKSWLRESSQLSPRCSDGTFLREMPLTSQDCPSNSQREKPISNCENTENPQLLLKYASLRNFSLNGKNNLAPNPQESEYFYDDYIDYPFNASEMDPNLLLGKDRNKVQNVEQIELISKGNNGNLTGNTPVLYAATSKTKPKPDIPHKIPDSPSTSGFTFFGIPLPTLNNLFAKKLDGEQFQNAERKAAIINSPKKDTRLLMPTINPTNQMEVLRPPTTPQFEGGFMPILPGYGGFKPITEPNKITTTTARIHDEKKVLDIIETTTIKPLNKKSFNLELGSNKSSLIISSDSSSVINNRNKKSQLVDDDVNKSGKLESIANIQYFNQSKIHLVKEYKNESINPDLIQSTSTTTTFLPGPTTSTTLRPKLEERSTIPSTSIDPILEIDKTSMETQIKITEDKTWTTTTTKKPKKTPTNFNINNSTTGSLLSTLVAPSFIKPTSKSTIVKVASPRESSSAPLLSSFEAPKHEFSSNVYKNVETTIVTSTEGSSNDWYFENYHKKNLEPFVSKVTVVEKSSSVLVKGKVLSIGLLLCFVFLIY